MKKLFGIAALLIAISLPALAQGQQRRLSADDQRRFDSYYSRWLDYKRTNNQGEVVSMEKRMQDIYAHYGIPSNVPYSRIASNGQVDRDRDRDWDRDRDRGRDRDRDWDRDRDRDRDRERDDGRQGGYGRWGRGNNQWRGRLSADDQRRFDSYYSRWLEYRRTNNQDEMLSMENRMRDVYAHNGIPSNVPFDQVASNGSQGNGGYQRGGGYGRWQGRLSADDQRRFDSYYSRWLQYRATNNQGEILSMENRMRDVYAHNGIPSNVPFDQVASPSVRSPNRY